MEATDVAAESISDYMLGLDMAPHVTQGYSLVVTAIFTVVQSVKLAPI